MAAPPPPTGSPPPKGVLAKLQVLDLCRTQVTDAGCAVLAAALDSGDSGALPALNRLYLQSIAASSAAKNAVGRFLGTRAPLEVRV